MASADQKQKKYDVKTLMGVLFQAIKTKINGEKVFEKVQIEQLAEENDENDDAVVKILKRLRNKIEEEEWEARNYNVSEDAHDEGIDTRFLRLLLLLVHEDLIMYNYIMGTGTFQAVFDHQKTLSSGCGSPTMQLVENDMANVLLHKKPDAIPHLKGSECTLVKLTKAYTKAIVEGTVAEELKSAYQFNAENTPFGIDYHSAHVSMDRLMMWYIDKLAVSNSWKENSTPCHAVALKVVEEAVDGQRYLNGVVYKSVCERGNNSAGMHNWQFFSPFDYHCILERILVPKIRDDDNDGSLPCGMAKLLYSTGYQMAISPIDADPAILDNVPPSDMSILVKKVLVKMREEEVLRTTTSLYVISKEIVRQAETYLSNATKSAEKYPNDKTFKERVESGKKRLDELLEEEKKSAVNDPDETIHPTSKIRKAYQSFYSRLLIVSLGLIHEDLVMNNYLVGTGIYQAVFNQAYAQMDSIDRGLRTVIEKYIEIITDPLVRPTQYHGAHAKLDKLLAKNASSFFDNETLKELCFHGKCGDK